MGKKITLARQLRALRSCPVNQGAEVRMNRSAFWHACDVHFSKGVDAGRHHFEGYSNFDVSPCNGCKIREQGRMSQDTHCLPPGIKIIPEKRVKEIKERATCGVVNIKQQMLPEPYYPQPYWLSLQPDSVHNWQADYIQEVEAAI